ncbi:MAG: hypothetical protein IT376_13085 [Polyangiaceae bacterium]|nr:hypothetical protein [Polyangiaceae bacterium]
MSQPRWLIAGSMLGWCAVAGCRAGGSGAGGQPAASAAAPDRWADGKALAEERARWKASWVAVVALPSCDALGADARAKCDAARDARARLMELEQRDAPAADALDAALELATRALAARRILEVHSLELAALAAASAFAPPFPSGSAAPPAPPASAFRPRPGGSGWRVPLPPALAGHAHERPKFEDPVRAYDGIVRLAFARLAGFLQIGPLPTRRLALERVRQLAEREGPTPAVRALLDEAHVTESDAGQKGDLAKLREQVRARRDGGGG